MVPALERPIDLTDMVAYAGATWDWHRLHYDRDYLDARGLPAPVVDGQVLGALLVETVQDWLGPGWRTARLTFRLTEMVFAGERVRCEGAVAAADERRVSCGMTVVVVGDGGSAARTAVAGATVDLVRRL